jgi:DNA segregation ATPase FtsK/SpoIIIE-like protein
MKYVYLLKAGENHYKVGIAVSVAKRVRGIQTSNALKIELVTARVVEDAYSLEKKIHQHLKGMITDGGTEWFRLTPEEAIEIAILINQSPEVDISDKVTLGGELQKQSRRQQRIEDKLDALLDIKKKAPLQEIIIEQPKVEEESTGDPMYERALEVISQTGKASTSLLQRKLSIGYGRAARLIERLEDEGYVSSLDGIKARQVLRAPVKDSSET